MREEKSQAMAESAIVAAGGSLTRSHDADVLLCALRMRLALDGRGGLAELIRAAERKESAGSFGRSGFYASAVVGRLRIEGRTDLADRLVSLLSGGPIDADPLLWLNEIDGRIALCKASAAELRAHGKHDVADLVESTLSNALMSALYWRLQADGRRGLADAIASALHDLDYEEPKEAPMAPPRPPVVEPPPERVARWALGEEIGGAHPAHALAYATIVKLRAGARENLATSIMMLWPSGIAGPIVDPAQLASMLLAQLRKEGRLALADRIASWLSGVSIDRDPNEIMTIWLNEIAGPIVDVGALSTGLIAALRREHHEDLADAVAALAI